MPWVCANCRAEYPDAPAEGCTNCGSATVIPADPEDEARSFETARAALDGRSPDSGLVNTSQLVAFAFRIVLMATLVFAFAVVVALLV